MSYSGFGFSFDALLDALKCAGEETRLRILALLRQGELTVSDFTDILGQSQPRVSRHLKLLVDGGLVERSKEGSWAYFRLNKNEGVGALISDVLSHLPEQDEVLRRDAGRLADVRAARARQAQEYFDRMAPHWDRLGQLHASSERVNAAILEMLGDRRIETLLDLGTGTGQILTLLGGQATRAVGLDANAAMLGLARSKLDACGLQVELRQGDVFSPPFAAQSFDLIVVHQVLHYLDDPFAALTQAARLLRPTGRLLLVDFAPHQHDEFRQRFGHRRLGFSREQMESWLDQLGLDLMETRCLEAQASVTDPLTVALWLAQDRRLRVA